MTSSPTSEPDHESSGVGDLIAVIGMHGRFPGAAGTEQLWDNLRDGKESISYFSDEELLAAGVDAETLRQPNYVKARGVIEDIERFDSAFFGMSPREAEHTDPQQRVFLECAWELFEKAGYDVESYTGAIGVYAGSAISSYLLNNLWGNPGLVGSAAPYNLVLANDKDHLTTRTAYQLSLRGPCVTVQTGCSTSLVAVHIACQALLSHECDMALAGGVALCVPQTVGYLFQENDKCSPDGHTRTFDANARGTVQSEGVAMVLLKRLDDAIRDGDSFYAVVRGSAINNDGAAKVGYTAPSVDGQADVIHTAQLLADVPVESIQYVECHGTATALGDPIEVAALTKAFRASTDRVQFCAVGSLKSNVGHMDTAAGAGGFIKAVLALHYRCIPPSLHFEQPNQEIDFAGSPFFVNAQRREWTSGVQQAPRRAAVSAFGVGGTNAHVILEESPPVPPSEPAAPWQLLLVSARTEAALSQATSNLRSYLQAHVDANLADVAYTLQVGRKAFAHRRIVAARDIKDAVATLEGLPPQRVFTRHCDRERQVVFLLPGQGPQYPGMGVELYRREPVFAQAIDRCSELLRPYNVPTLTDELLAPSRADTAGASLTQPMLFAFEYALSQLWLSWGVLPQALIGHSMGEYVAATLAGVIDLADALRVIVLREQMLHQLPAGAILTVMVQNLEELPSLGEDTAITAFNGPGIYSISGTVAAIDALEIELQRRQVVHSRMPVSLVSHGAMVKPVLEPFRQVLKQVQLRSPQIPFLSNVTGTWITAEQATDPEYWVRHLCEPVQFSKGLSVLLQQDDWILLEVGPGRALASLVLPHERSAEQVVIASLPQPSNSETELVLQALGKVWAAGGAIDRGALHGDARRQRVVLPTYPFERQRCWVDAPCRSTAEVAVGGQPQTQRGPVVQPATDVVTAPRAGLDEDTASLTDAQALILRLWYELLGVPRIGMHESFFDLGGSSLLGIQLHTRIKEQFEVELVLKDLLENPTIAAMAELVELTILREIESLES